MSSGNPLGSVIRGSLTKGLEIRLHSDVSVEDMRVGKFLVIQGVRSRFFCMVTDVALGTANERIIASPPNWEDTFLREVLAGSSTYGIVTLAPMLMFTPEDTEHTFNGKSAQSSAFSGNGLASFQPQTATTMELLPVKTIPTHFSQVYEAEEYDFRKVFGWEDDQQRKNFSIGKPLDMDVPVCIDLNRFVERSNGVFGKSGTGKSFLTRLLLAGVIRKNAAVNLIFDMHSEYGWEAVAEGKEVSTVKGLKQLFPDKVEVYTLDPEATKRRGVRDAQELYLNYEQIEVEDLKLCANELGVSDASMDSASILYKQLGDRWIPELLGMTGDDIKLFCDENPGHVGSIAALQRKLMRLENLKYIRNARKDNYIKKIVQSLEAGKNVVIEFGTQSNMLSYMLVTNMITRRIHDHYVTKADKFLHTKNPLDKPTPLMITIEEAHRFLDSAVVQSTIFGTIARELRKYFVTLLVVDQRPSGIDNEIMSQIGTRITALLNDEKDIEAIFTGVSGGSVLRSVLAKLDSKQQALILGHAVPMPVVIRTRAYDGVFYKEIGDVDWQEMSDVEVFAAAKLAKADLGF
ncbi:ATPase [Cylindrospermopsis raciborskii S07]|jgi:DNA helicase HerA-like ATPase|uniref:ATP-binding protein n=2 Tax=Cylindrospermopsis raciborskii TaxID=77022 RepID=A0A838WKI4_9CYAN|nr:MULTISPECIES: ATP-binding protein [Cylindrospermopsis]MBU6344768.1 ATP-binding protein [Cyanobacteria bacterium REEB494]KRH96009.1 ATPase [Cylindrospermopsis sp. CR12]MBA4446193.1 ATP-binding protein [Cylindrospermopsis raciborskii CS-506_C]MBA4450429.1 ATP-binding protein [Cylindrospermopsis raciborskii CS-506_D]MBA4457045.1 ATP-binding protein [Cylindrospermopsis raciborskii CS-506_B]